MHAASRAGKQRYTGGVPEEPAQNGRSPHVLDLSGQLGSIARDVSGSVSELRQGVGKVVEGTGIVLRPEENPTEQIIAAVEAKAAAPAAGDAGSGDAPFQPYRHEYYGSERQVRSAAEEKTVRARDAENEKRFRSQPAKLLRGYDGRTSPALTAARLAAHYEQRMRGAA